MSIFGSQALALSTAPAYSRVVDPIYTAPATGAGLSGFIIGNPSASAVAVTIYRDNLTNVLWSGTIPANTVAQTVNLLSTLTAGETIWAIGSPGGVVTIEVDGLTSNSTGTLTQNQLLLALLLMFANAFGCEIPSATDLNPLSYGM